ncbi:hypothetical protein Lal_00041536 [Lupinus albus]|nr:hypothetical protein Lal_00041536 [Lupinus albus]
MSTDLQNWREIIANGLGQVKCSKHENENEKSSDLEVKEGLRMMENEKVIGPKNILIEVHKVLGEHVIIWLTKLLNEMMRSKKCHESGG